MADVTIDGTVVAVTARGLRSVVFTTPLIGYWFYLDSTGIFGYSKTTDGGATWAAFAAVDGAAAATTVAFDVWYDRWTPSDNGTLIHTWWFDTTNDIIRWRTLDTNGDTLGTVRTVFTGVSAVAGNTAYVSGTKTRSGYLYCCSAIDASNEQYFGRSTDAGVTWSAALSATFQEANPDHATLFPASNTGDDNDCWAVYQDSSALALTIKMWDSSAVAQVESATVQTIIAVGTDLTVYQMPFSGSIRHSDGHLILVSCSDRDTATTNMQAWDISAVNAGSSTGIAALTNITTNIDDNYHPSVFIDQATNAIYVVYNGKRDGSEVLGTTTKVYYTKSTDGGTTWSAGDTAYMEGAAGVVVQVWAPISGQRFFAGWRVGTTLIGNAVNSLGMALFANLTETLHIIDVLQSATALATSLTEALHLSDVGGGTVNLIGNIKGSETISAALAASDLNAVPTAEALHVTETVQVALDLSTVLVETLKFAEVITFTANLAAILTEALLFSETLSIAESLAVQISETLVLAESVSEILNPLLVAVPAEALKLSETLVDAGFSINVVLSETLVLAESVSPSITPLVVAALVETLVLSEVLSISINLAASATEDLHLVEGPVSAALVTGGLSVSVTEALHLSDVGGGTVNLIGNIKASETVTVVIGVGLFTSLSEALHLAETLTIVRSPLEVLVSETLVLQDAVASYIERVQIETFVIAEVVTAQLVDLILTFSATETLKFDETATPALQLAVSILEALIFAETASVALISGGSLTTSVSETLHIAEDLTSSLTPLLVSITEALVFSESAIALGDLLASASETLHLQDISPSVALVESGSLATSASETFRIDESVTPALSPLFVNVTEALLLSETVNTSSNLAISTTETFKFAETAAISLELAAVAAETLKFTETVTPGLNLSVVAAEILVLSETATPALTPLLVSLSEALLLAETLFVSTGLSIVATEAFRVSETLIATDIDLVTALTETLKIVDAITAALNLAVQVQEALVIAETATANNPLLVTTLAETLHIAEVISLGINLLTASLSEQLHIVDVWFAQLGDAATIDVVGTYAITLDTVGVYSTDIDVVGKGVA